jgi:carbamoyl-phosphate synthase large subunit
MMNGPTQRLAVGRVLILGSGALQIGQAGEFDYSGSQAIKALREEGVGTVLVNPNIATIQTSEKLADRIYLHSLDDEFVKQIILQEHVDAIMLAFGGQTALNCGLRLHDSGFLAEHGVQVLGTPIEAIRRSEDRHLFVKELDSIDVVSAKSRACHSAEEAAAAAAEIGFPVMLRGGYALGGKGSGIVDTPADLDRALRRAFAGDGRQVLVEECLQGWKEIEYEIVRDAYDNTIAVCNMENLDPLGIHTGESIVVAPSQTLDDEEYQSLRSLAIRIVRHIGVIGECNVQFALDPHSREYRVIEMNARLSRSSALASKATGYPLAYVASKLALGYSLADIPNGITGCTSAFFEPALDYLVCKVPRWDLTKFAGSVKRIGSEMKSVGEVMAIGRSLPEVLQKALRMLDIGVDGLDPDAFTFTDLDEELRHATPRRIFAVALALREGMSIEDLHERTRIDRWFLHQIAAAVRCWERLREARGQLAVEELREAKRLGMSDLAIGRCLGRSRTDIRRLRKTYEIVPRIAQIDTLAGEFPATTNYLYTTFGAERSDIEPSAARKIMVLGSGAYRIGSSVEFDWCCVSAVEAASELGYETIMVNYNPETVSTDYDVCNRLVFDEISLETIMDLFESEQPDGVVVSMGGQIPNNLAIRLHEAGIPIVGTCPTQIDRAEDRGKFSALLDELGIDQPRWAHITDPDKAEEQVAALGGFPVLVRPSYVLSGAAMSVAHEHHELLGILGRAKSISPEHPVVVSKFETNAREIEVDAVADKGELVLWAVSEHVEDAGVHSGDATLISPPQRLYFETIKRVRKIAEKLAAALEITGPFNVQFLAKQNAVKVIECNLRASRSFPFVSKVLGRNLAAEAMRRMLGAATDGPTDNLNVDHVGVKAPMFSFSRLTGVDPMLGVEMASTGEVGCIGEDLHEALLHALLATGFDYPQRAVLLSLGPVSHKYQFAEEAAVIADQLGLAIYATEGTARMLEEIGIDCRRVEKTPDSEDSAMDFIEGHEIDLVINVPREYDAQGRPDGFYIRRCAVDCGVPLITDLQLARAVVEAMRNRRREDLQVIAWNDYLDPASRIGKG